METLLNDKIIRVRDLVRFLNLSRTTIWRMEKSGELPPRIQVSEGVSGWLESDIKEWLENRRESRTEGKPKTL